MLHKKTSVEGFTLIELLVVIAIIGILSSIVLSSINLARAKGRDARRRTDLRQLEIALELNYQKYGAYTQPEGHYSDCSTGTTGTPVCGTGTDWGATSDLRDLLTDGFIVTLPVDPINDATYRYSYEPWNAGQGGYVGAGQAYDLCAPLERGGSFCINKRSK